MGKSEHGDGRRGASPPAIPCFFVTGHHAPCLNRGAEPDSVVPHRSQALVSSSSSTTSMGESEHGDGRRGASPPAIPCFFVVEHHAPCLNRGSRPDDVVLHRPQTLVSSSLGTTSDGRIGARGRTAWCFTARKPLFLRRRAPRRMGKSEHGDGRRGASPPANPCFFVAGHHAPCLNRGSEPDSVVLHRPLSLISSSPSTTPSISSNRTIPGTLPGFPEFPSCARHGTSLTGESPVTGIYRQV